MEKHFICLANSYKRGGRCVAGIEIVYDAGGNWTVVHNIDGTPHWIRPIDTSTVYGEIPYQTAYNIKHFSIIKLTGVVAYPQGAHIENVHFSQIEVIQDIFPLAKEKLNLFTDSLHQSVFRTRGKAINTQMLSGLTYSLMFIHVQNARAFIDENREKSKNRMCFTYYGTEYDLPITDPAFLEEFRNDPDRFAIIPNVYLTLSLGLEFEGWHHKLVAGVIIPSDSQQSIDTESVSYMEQQKRIHTNAYAKWTLEDDERLEQLYDKGLSVKELAQMFGRNEGAIRARMNKLGLASNDIPCSFDNEASRSDTTQQRQQDWFTEYESELARLLDKKAEIEGQISELRQKLLKQMENNGLDRINSRQFSVSYTPAKTVMQFDSHSFRLENEELYSSYCRPRQREASIVVKRNKTD